MQALHGRGLCLWRLGRTDAVRRIFAQILKLSSNKNQAARYLLTDLSWEQGVERE